MAKDNKEDRPTISMPGTDGAVSGTAVNEWVDDDGNPKFSDESKNQQQTPSRARSRTTSLDAA